MGASLAHRLLEEGAYVCVGDINKQALTKLLPELQKKGKAIAVDFDLAEEASIESLVARCISEFGGLDGVAIPAADFSKAAYGSDRDLMNMDPRVWERSFKVNVLGHALLIKASIPHMAKAGGGSVVCVSSISAFLGDVAIPAYAVTKSGLHALVRHVASVGGKDNIRCNAVAPSLVKTENSQAQLNDNAFAAFENFAPLKRFGVPDDMASLMAFLLSDESTWITGQVISINGGHLFRD